MWRPALAALVLFLAGCGAAPEPALEPAADPPRRVFLITVDTLRADHLGWHGYPRDTSPRLDEWVERGVVFERAIVQWPKTGPSFASMFTSLYPHTTGLINTAAQTIPDDYLALPAWFQERGFTTAAVISNPVLSLELGWGRGFDRYEQTWVDQATLDAVDELPVEQRPMAFRRHVWADRVNELAAPLLASLASEERLFATRSSTSPVPRAGRSATSGNCATTWPSTTRTFGSRTGRSAPSWMRSPPSAWRTEACSS